MRLTFFLIAVVLITESFTSASGQGAKSENDENETCSGQVYERKEVTRPAQIRLPVVLLTEEARAKNLRGTLSLTAVLCRTGRVTDIVVVKELPYGMTGRVVEALRRTKFTPAVKDGEEVSQKVRAEFRFNVD